MQIISDKDKDCVRKTVKVLNMGGLVIYPTDTCYGIGVDATNEEAVKKLIKYKERQEGKAISISVNSLKMAKKYVEINDTAKHIYENFLPGAFTVISNSKHKASKLLESEKGTLGVRIPDYVLLTSIVKTLGKPITATSANIQGGKTPYCIEDILKNVPKKNLDLIDLIIDAGELKHNLPSSVIDTTQEDMKVLRKGSIDIGKREEIFTNTTEETIKLGEILIGRYLKELENNCLIVVFNAEMGAGKTQLVKGIAKGLKIKEIIKSPTYTYISEHSFGNSTLYHIDLWKLEKKEEFKELRIDKYIQKGNVIAIEWGGSVIKDLIGILKEKENSFETKIILIDIEYLSETKRKILIGDIKI